MVALTKQDIRQAHTAARKQLTDVEKQRKDALLTQAIVEKAQGLKIAAYSPLGSEPGGSGFVEALHAAAAEVWLPLTGKSGILTWSLYEGPESMASGSLGIAEPTGQRHDSAMLADLDIIFAPALAVDRTGMRLGKGAGYYDRALVSARPRPPVIAVVYAEEVIDRVPHDAYDQAVDSIITD